MPCSAARRSTASASTTADRRGEPGRPGRRRPGRCATRAPTCSCRYLPVGSEEAQKHYAQACLDAGVAFVNAIPVFIASDPEWAQKFTDAGVPIVGDDIKSQVGATIVHRILARLFEDRGMVLDRTYQLNVGGNMDFKNMLERERLESKKISKTQAVTSQIDHGIEADDVHIGPSDHVPWLDDRKWAYIRLEGRNFGDVPLNLELKLEVWDSPNSAGVIIDALRCAKIAHDRGIGGPLLGPVGLLHEVAAGAVPRRRGPPRWSRSSHAGTAASREAPGPPTRVAPLACDGVRRMTSNSHGCSATSNASVCSSSAAATASVRSSSRAGRDRHRGRPEHRGRHRDRASAAEAAEVRIELHTGDLADLAFLRADSVDVAFADGRSRRSPTSAVCSARSTGCCGRAPVRVLAPAPRAACVDHRRRARRLAAARPAVRRPLRTSTTTCPYGTEVHPHRIGDVFALLGRVGFRVDTLLEPEPPATARRPGAAPRRPSIWRARKVGS